MKNQLTPTSFIDVGRIVTDLTHLGWQPVLIGGMALVALGSRRVTWDFDFVIKNPSHQISHFIDVFYSHGFLLASEIDSQGEITTTFKNSHEAIKYFTTEKPTSAFFINPYMDLKIDVIFDYPIPAKKLLKDATQFKVGRHTFWIAYKTHLLQLKQLAVSSRGDSRDVQDLEFLRALLKKK